EGFLGRLGRMSGRGRVLVGPEAERLDQAGLAVRTGAGGRLGRLGRVGALLSRADQRAVVRLDVIAALQGRAQPDVLGDLTTRSAGPDPGAGLVVLVDLQGVLVVVLGDGVPE